MCDLIKCQIFSVKYYMKSQTHHNTMLCCLW